MCNKYTIYGENAKLYIKKSNIIGKYLAEISTLVIILMIRNSNIQNRDN